ncbi:hypothetical protein HPP92_017947 [Vanilla planifolia]|uniref:Protein GLUTAMINE DUMPER 3 n=1 Tax=Vanilla planifolia TaxID=51239 RepID=A0A835QA78_VANPL|nr:hypothetical protein HPP92_017947 [Vanilla planifolia]
MRPGATFAEEHVAHSPASRLGAAGRSAWHSPVPYLFGGLAAMLGLIAFALLILACSYWKLSGFLEGGGDGAPAAGGRGRRPETRVEAADRGEGGEGCGHHGRGEETNVSRHPCFEQGVVVRRENGSRRRA